MEIKRYCNIPSSTVLASADVQFTRQIIHMWRSS